MGKPIRELGRAGVLAASALVFHSHLAIIRLARRIPIKRARLLGWIKVKGRLAERTPVPRPHTEGPPRLQAPLGMSKRHFKDLAGPLSSHVCPLSPRGRPCVQLSWGSTDLWAWRGGAVSQRNGPLNQTNTASRVLTSGTGDWEYGIQESPGWTAGGWGEHVQGLRP